ncbi:Stk1 family PASTA domain-containing Ser/Thr kinase [Oerskovia turbata]|uniref:non-specific serine/threonine protein kinase n=1 Tax=Oerskovia turbata TaxID=1713 RepID=A0A4Q1KPP3_9CELL|nr:Stk1 family PASTA domain-containing Ser/Thr kinase [Oerskovia turbata]RXR21752.1 Stk1 family PASTA domain-containing Ser/Thr kinase [Oerskovia turbata]RXR31450.1 Stk1 family PASTA domain-containing Ser/Thr kinase [Oerskovia turbata]TGJ95948.1 Stk1 family PASTA domain-containing Ser/Thr kinase [Actinotalea fermentans ATCC 43279 = JCM 9966 = DSM 3133]
MVDNAPRVLAGRYEVGELIGRGGMAEVHIGHDTRLGRTVAIKILRSDLARDPSFLARFRREAQAAAALNHPAIVAVYDTGEDTHVEPGGGTAHVPFIVMEYVEGHTVRDILGDGQAVPIDEAIEITAGVLSALEYSHHAGIVHRDIKPANVMITPTGAVKVMDFGIARAVADSAATMTQTHAVIGTAQYLSPEQARGETVDARSDLYSTGCLLFELLTGRPPFIGDSPVAVAYQHVREAPAKPSDLAPDVPEVLDRITLKALAKERTARYSSAAEFRNDLENAVRGGHITAPALGVAAAAAAGAAALAATQVQGPLENATQVMSPAVAGPPNPWETTGVPAAVPPGQPGGPLTEGEPDDEGSGKKRGLMWALIAVGAVAIAAIITMFLLNQQPPEPKMVTVPPFSATTTPEQAEQALDEVGLTFLKAIDQESDLPKDTFVSSTPPSGESVEEGTEVTVYFSAGPDAVIVPDVAGLTQEQARAEIENAGLVVDPTVDQEDNGTVKKGLVTRTDPAASASAPAGSSVKIFISSGLINIPELVGLPQADAEAALDDLDLSYAIVEEESTKTEGTVIKQNPGPGPGKQGQKVTLTIAEAPAPTGPEMTNVPDVVGMTREEAIEALGGRQLNPGNITEKESATVPKGRVISSNPEKDAVLEEGAKVDLVISSGPPAGGGNGGGGDDGGGGNSTP